MAKLLASIARSKYPPGRSVLSAEHVCVMSTAVSPSTFLAALIAVLWYIQTSIMLISHGTFTNVAKAILYTPIPYQGSIILRGAEPWPLMLSKLMPAANKSYSTNSLISSRPCQLAQNSVNISSFRYSYCVIRLIFVHCIDTIEIIVLDVTPRCLG